MTNKDFLKHFRHEIHRESLVRPSDFFFCKDFLKYVARPGFEVHHGAGRAYSDFWAIALRPEVHQKLRDIGEPYMSDIFANFLVVMWSNVFSYSVGRRQVKIEKGIEIYKEDYKTPATWFKLIEKIKEVK